MSYLYGTHLYAGYGHMLLQMRDASRNLYYSSYN
jgi:hypothetical protein